MVKTVTIRCCTHTSTRAHIFSRLKHIFSSTFSHLTSFHSHLISLSYFLFLHFITVWQILIVYASYYVCLFICLVYFLCDINRLLLHHTLIHFFLKVFHSLIQLCKAHLYVCLFVCFGLYMCVFESE